MFLNSAEGVVIEVVRPGHEWVVRVHDVYWHARTLTQSDFVPEERVQVAGRDGHKLLIEPL
ncbi:MAG: NfeD family protein [Cyanobacteria bacterium P01_D01_bin.56]